MSGTPPAAPSSAAPKTTLLMLATFADLYRQEVGAEEDVYRTLPFFGTALGIVLGALAYAAGRLPRWSDLSTQGGRITFVVATVLLGLAIIEAGCVLLFLSRAISRSGYRRVGPEPELRARLSALQGYYTGRGMTGDEIDTALVTDMQQLVLDAYTGVTPANRDLNERRYALRARAALHLVRSLMWALGATTVILMTVKLGYLPGVTQ